MQWWLLHEILDEQPAASMRVAPRADDLQAIVPKLMTAHGEAYARCRQEDARQGFHQASFNRRISAWNGLLLACDIADDRAAAAYVLAHVDGGTAYRDEVENLSQMEDRVRRLVYATTNPTGSSR